MNRTGHLQKSGSAAEVVYCGMFTALIAVGAFIKIMLPVGIFEVTFSLQFLFAVLSGLLLGARKGFFSVLSYLVIGLTGVPVFAHGGGPAYVLKPTFGFLLGFAAAAYVAGFLRQRIRSVSFPKLLAAAFAGELAYYACGLIYLYVMMNVLLTGSSGIGVRELILVWFLSTAVPDFLLCVLAAYLALRLRTVLEAV